MSYNTKQREALLKFFNDNHDKVFSVDEIAEKLSNNGISLSAVYRNLAELEKKGKVKRISKAGDRKAYYQYMDCDSCKCHLHMSCTKCGKTMHLDSGAEIILEGMLKNASFNLDTASTVLYGLCEKCNK